MTVQHLRQMVQDFLDDNMVTQVEVGTPTGVLPLITIEREGQRVVLEGFVEWIEDKIVEESLAEQLNTQPTSKRSIN